MSGREVMAAALQTVTLDIGRGARGRPRAPLRSVPDVVSVAYLVRISKKYEIETFKFLKCIHAAWVKGRSSCDGVSVRRRLMTKDIATFLITRDHKIIAQFRLTSRVLGYLVKPEIRNLRFEDSSAAKWKSWEAEASEIKDFRP
jgi:hypothetical protein